MTKDKETKETVGNDNDDAYELKAYSAFKGLMLEYRRGYGEHLHEASIIIAMAGMMTKSEKYKGRCSETIKKLVELKDTNNRILTDIIDLWADVECTENDKSAADKDKEAEKKEWIDEMKKIVEDI